MYVACLSLGTLAIAANTNPTKEKPDPKKQEISKQIFVLLENTYLKVAEKDLVAYVQLFINKKSQLVVLDVQSSSKALEAFVKNRLNYKEIEAAQARKSKRFSLKIRVTNNRIDLTK